MFLNMVSVKTLSIKEKSLQMSCCLVKRRLRCRFSCSAEARLLDHSLLKVQTKVNSSKHKRAALTHTGTKMGRTTSTRPLRQQLLAFWDLPGQCSADQAARGGLLSGQTPNTTGAQR